MKELKQRVLDVSYEHKLSHLGSCLSAVDIIDHIYSIKEPDERFVLSAGHAHLAHLVVMEKYEGIDLKEALEHGIHCDVKAGCDVTTGSLGMGLPIAVGMALADRSKNVYCLISDGECTEGVIWEALRIAQEQGLNNLHVYCNANGYAAYQEVDVDLLEKRLHQFFPVEVIRTNNEPFEGLEAHYKVMTKEEYERVSS